MLAFSAAVWRAVMAVPGWGFADFTPRKKAARGPPSGAGKLLDRQALCRRSGLLGQYQLEHAVPVARGRGGLVDFVRQGETAAHPSRVALGAQDLLARLPFGALLHLGADRHRVGVDRDLDVGLVHTGQVGVDRVALVVLLDVHADA